MIDFAELREFEELKLKNYSSGMHVRLAFSVAIQVDADILLVDEVLAVGDAAFQQKCFDVFTGMRDEGRTIVFVTHDMGALNRFCHRALLLERGSTGPPRRAARGRRPLPGDQLRARPGGGAARRGARAGDGEARVLEAWIEDERGERQAVARRRASRLTLKALVRFMVDVEDPGGERVRAQRGPRRHRRRHERASSTSAAAASRRARRSVFSFSFDNVLAPGRYSPVFTLAHRGIGLDVMDRFEGAFSFVVTGSRPQGGLVDLPAEVAIERGTGDRPRAGRSVRPTSPRATERHRRSTALEGLGRPIKGPRALTDDWARFWHLTYNIARNEWKLRFFGSALGYVWQLDAPAAAVRRAVRLLRRDLAREQATGRQALYGAQLLGSIVLFTFFAEATGGAVRSVVDRENLVRKIQFPRLVIPLSIVLLASFNLGLNLIVVLDLRPHRGRAADAHAGSSCRSSSRCSSSSRPAWRCCCRRCSSTSATSSRSGTSIPQVLFYASPTIIPVTVVARAIGPDRLCTSTCSTRSRVVFQQFRHAMITHTTPSAAAALGGWARLIAPLAHRRRRVRARLLRVQPHRAARRREPLTRRRVVHECADGSRTALRGRIGAAPVARRRRRCAQPALHRERRLLGRARQSRRAAAAPARR